MRNLFVSMLVWSGPQEPGKLLDEFWDSMGQDFLREAKKRNDRNPKHSARVRVILEINSQLEAMQKDLKTIFSGRPDVLEMVTELAVTNKLIEEESTVYNPADEDAYYRANHPLMNVDQRSAFDEISRAVQGRSSQKVFFVDGPGGTGKTFLYKLLASSIRRTRTLSENGIVLCVASSGIASVLLPGGRTAHSRFKIPVSNLHGSSMCRIPRGTALAKLLQETRLIIWDEAPMTHRHCFEALDRTLQDITECS